MYVYAQFFLQLAEIKRMRCPNALTVAWFEIPPYIYNTSDGKPGGVFYNVLSQMVDFCCPQRTNLSFSENPVKLSQFQGLLDNGTDDILLPIYGDGRKNDRLGEPFISLGESMYCCGKLRKDLQEIQIMNIRLLFNDFYRACEGIF